jgi:hypothetical protein
VAAAAASSLSAPAVIAENESAMSMFGVESRDRAAELAGIAVDGADSYARACRVAPYDPAV